MNGYPLEQHHACFIGLLLWQTILIYFMVESIVVELFCCENRTGDGSSVMSTIKQRSATLV